MPTKPSDPNATDAPHKNCEAGVARPESVLPKDSEGETPDQDGIEIDNAIERPQECQPGQPGAKLN